MAKKITFLDKAFWLTESDQSPKHVACLQLLEVPENSSDSYVADLVEEMRSFDKPLEPFNCVVRRFLGFPTKLEVTEQLDMEYHVAYHEIDDADDSVDLHKFVARLHEPRLDKNKPLWQFHLIKSLTSNTLAIYVKIHHMYGDGTTLIRWFQKGYMSEPVSENFVPVWAADLSGRRKKHARKGKVSGFLLSLLGFVVVIKDLLWIFFRLLVKLLRLNTVYMPVPFTGTKTILTGQVKKGRVVATVDLDFNRVQMLSRRLRATVNEVLLCCFDIGVHRFLKDSGYTFNKALYTHMPINLRRPGDETSGNKIAIVPVKLAHGKKDPYLRLRQIIFNHRLVKNAAKRSHPASFSYYTVCIQSFSLIFELLRLSEWFKPIANILISNVPGPKETRYFKDARLKAMYPISTIVPGGGVNITLLTYGSTANIGIVCCDTKIKSLEPMAEYFVEAFGMLEQCIDNPELNIDDIGEKIIQDDKSIIEEPNFTVASDDRSDERTVSAGSIQ